MTGGVIEISLWQLALALVFIGVSGLVTLMHRLGFFRDLLVGTVRAFVQLTLMGYALTVIFGLGQGLLGLAVVVTVFVSMIFFAARIIKGRVKETQVRYLGETFLAMVAGYGIVTVMVTGVIVGAKPWWTPQYFIPLGGMVIGNSMNALAIALERLFSGLRANRAAIEMQLALGADYAEASQEQYREALRAGMIPSINSMMGVGFVFLPGMMTGQILAGADPLTAVRYQIVVMLMLTASTALSTIIVVYLARKRSFTDGQRLRLTPLHG